MGVICIFDIISCPNQSNPLKRKIINKQPLPAGCAVSVNRVIQCNITNNRCILRNTSPPNARIYHLESSIPDVLDHKVLIYLKKKKTFQSFRLDFDFNPARPLM